MEETSPQPRAVAITRPRTSPIAQPVRQCSVAEIAVRVRSLNLSTPHQTPDGRHQLLGLLCTVVLVRAEDAVLCVVVEEPERDLVERGLNCGDLGQDVDAVAVVCDHALDPAHLSLDAAQALEQLFLCRGVPACFGRGHDHTVTYG